MAGAHHAAVGGSLVVVDPSRVRLDPRTGRDDLGSIQVLTPEVCFPEAQGWPSTYFHSPWPLSEDFYLVSFSLDPLPGMGPNVKKDTETGLYYLDRFGNLELLYREPGISCMYPIPLARRPVPPALPSTVDSELGDAGELYLADVNNSLLPLPADRPIASLRIYQVLPKTETHVANEPCLGYANAEVLGCSWVPCRSIRTAQPISACRAQATLFPVGRHVGSRQYRRCGASYTSSQASAGAALAATSTVAPRPSRLGGMTTSWPGAVANRRRLERTAPLLLPRPRDAGANCPTAWPSAGRPRYSPPVPMGRSHGLSCGWFSPCSIGTVCGAMTAVQDPSRAG